MQRRLCCQTLAFAVLLLLAACGGGRGEVQHAGPPAQVYCEGFIHITVPADALTPSTYGPLRCNGECPSGLACAPRERRVGDPPGLVQVAWCGCPEDDGANERRACHVERSVHQMADGRVVPRVHCRPEACGCPGTDVCRERQRDITPADAAEGVRLVQFTCECVAP
jgi:hypothetical protein